MIKHRRLAGAVTAAVLALGGAAVAAPSDARGGQGHPGHHGHHGHHGQHQADATAVRAWNEIAVSTLTGLPGPAGGAPPAAQVHVAMVQGAVFDAVNAIEGRHFRPYLMWTRFPRAASVDAAVAAASHGVLHHLLSTVPNVPDATRATLLDTLAGQYADALAAVPDGWAERQGRAAGEAAALRMNEARADDGRFGPSPWVPDPSPGHWTPQTDPVTGQPLLDPTAWVGDVEPFSLASATQFRTPGPPDLTSSAWAADLNEVKSLGAATSTARTAEQTYIARWWQSTPVRLWNDVARDLSTRHGLGALRTARLLALQNLSGADAAISCWNDKYHWDFWRPADAIRRAAEDGNPATEPDPTWTPLISAPYPEVPSGHLCLDGAHTRILRLAFGDAVDGGFTMTSVSTLLADTDARVRHFESFSEVLAEIVEARMWAGLHFRFADVQGRMLGERVAGYVAWHELRPAWRHRHHHHH